MAIVKSIRERALEALVDVLRDQKKGVPTADPFSFSWDAVQREPLIDGDSRRGRIIAVMEGDENKQPGVGFMSVDLEVELNFRIFLEARDNPYEALNETLLNLQRAIRQDIQLGGLVYNVIETGNTLDVTDFAERQVEGSLFLLIRYKHFQDDPREIRQGVVPA